MCKYSHHWEEVGAFWVLMLGSSLIWWPPVLEVPPPPTVHRSVLCSTLVSWVTDSTSCSEGDPGKREQEMWSHSYFIHTRFSYHISWHTNNNEHYISAFWLLSKTEIMILFLRTFWRSCFQNHIQVYLMAAAQVAKKLKDKRKQRTIEGIFKKASKVVAEQRMEIDHLWCETMKKFYRSEKCLSNCFTRDKTFAHLQFCRTKHFA